MSGELRAPSSELRIDGTGTEGRRGRKPPKPARLRPDGKGWHLFLGVGMGKVPRNLGESAGIEAPGLTVRKRIRKGLWGLGRIKN